MPWLETAPMDQRSRFIDAHLAGGFTMTELCLRFQISRRVGYKWIARYDAEGLRLTLDSFTLSGRFWVWDVQTNTPFSSELTLTTNDVARWRFAGPEIRFTDLATGDIRQDRMGPMLVSWRLKVPFATAIKAVDTGENPSTRLLIESSLGTRDASRYVIRLPPVLINGEEYILKPIKLELHRFDGGLEPFNC